MKILDVFYYSGYLIKKKRALKKQKRLPKRVISVGNITLGGTGKTPSVIALANEAMKRGLRPCILTRGYKGKRKKPVFIGDGEGSTLDISEAGDEPVLIKLRLGDVEIIKGRDRYKAGLLSKHPDLFILDDGFQHWNLYRDIDIVLIDMMKGFGNGRLFPFGPLREPPSELKRADIIIKTRQNLANSKSVEGIINKILSGKEPSPLICTSEHTPSFFMNQKRKHFNIKMIYGKKVLAFCGIANPDGFIQTLKSIGTDIIEFIKFRDHHIYRQSDIVKIQEKASLKGADCIITTEKDIIKTTRYRVADNFFALCIDFDINKGFYDRVFQNE